MLRNATSKSRTIVLAGLAIAAVAGAGALRTDLLLSRGFGKALETTRSGLSFETSATKGQAQNATSGDEGYWLTRAEVESPSPFAKPLAIGDRITIAGRDGLERRLEVVDLKAIGENPARGGAQLRLMLVTCRVTGAPAGASEATVRFIVEAEPAEPALPPAKAL